MISLLFFMFQNVFVCILTFWVKGKEKRNSKETKSQGSSCLALHSLARTVCASQTIPT
jgi:hypothetical protein